MPTQTPTYTSLTALSSPLIDTIVTTTLIGITTSSVTTSTSGSPTLTTPLLAENILTLQQYPTSDSSILALTNALNQLPSSSNPTYQNLTPTSDISDATVLLLETSSSNNSNINQVTTSSGNLSSSSIQQQQSSPSNVSSTSRSSVQSHFPLTLPHIDEDDEDENCQSGIALLLQQDHAALRIVENKVQSDNLISLYANTNNNVKSFSSTDSSSSSINTSALTPSPKIKVSRIKFNQQQIPLSLSSSSTSSESETSVTTTIPKSEDNKSPNKMQAESGSIAELQKYQNKYLKNRRHTLAANTAINLRWVMRFYFNYPELWFIIAHIITNL